MSNYNPNSLLLVPSKERCRPHQMLLCSAMKEDKEEGTTSYVCAHEIFDTWYWRNLNKNGMTINIQILFPVLILYK